MVTVTTTTYGRSAAVALHARIRASKDGDPLAPVTVVVPTNYAGASVRRLLGSGELGPVVPGTAGITGLQLTTVSRLAEQIGAPALTAAGRRPATTPVVAATVRRVLDAEPGIFGEVKDHIATVEALTDAHRELGTLAGGELDRLAATSSRAADVVRIHRRVTDELANGFYGVPDLLAAARDAVDTSPIVPELGVIIVYLPQRLTRPEADLLLTISQRTRLDVLAALTGHTAADADVHRSLNLLDATAESADQPPVTATRVISTSDAEEECRSAVGVVLDALRGTSGDPAVPNASRSSTPPPRPTPAPSARSSTRPASPGTASASTPCSRNACRRVQSTLASPPSLSAPRAGWCSARGRGRRIACRAG